MHKQLPFCTGATPPWCRRFTSCPINSLGYWSQKHSNLLCRPKKGMVIVMATPHDRTYRQVSYCKHTEQTGLQRHLLTKADSTCAHFSTFDNLDVNEIVWSVVRLLFQTVFWHVVQKGQCQDTCFSDNSQQRGRNPHNYLSSIFAWYFSRGKLSRPRRKCVLLSTPYSGAFGWTRWTELIFRLSRILTWQSIL